jgi:hypothetical protein
VTATPLSLSPSLPLSLSPSLRLSLPLQSAHGSVHYVWRHQRQPRQQPPSEPLVHTGLVLTDTQVVRCLCHHPQWTGEGDWGEFHAGYGGTCDDVTPPFGYCECSAPRLEDTRLQSVQQLLACLTGPLA